MLLCYELVFVVGVGASITVFAVLIHDDVAAHLSLLHLFDFLVELMALLFALEVLLLR